MNWWKENKLQRRIYVCAAALTAAAFGWYALTRAGSLAGLVAAGLSCLLFALCLLRGVDHALCFFTAEPLPSPDARLGRRSLRRDKRHPWERIVLFMLITRLFLFAVGYAFHAAGGVYEGGIWDTLRACWLKSDSPSYLGIAENWYVNDGKDRLLIVFYPMLPLLMRILNPVFHNSFVSAQIINTIATCLASGTAYLTLYGILGKKRSVHAALLSLLLPGAIFLNSPMTEPLFMLFCFCAFYCLQKHKFILSAVFTALAGFTRSLGVVLAAAIFIEGVGTIVRNIRDGKKCGKQIIAVAAALVISTLGTVAYLLINYNVSGDFFIFMEYEKLNWDQQLGLFFDTMRYIWDWCVNAIPNGNISVIYSLWIPTVLIAFASLALITDRMRELPSAYIVFFLAYYVLAMGCTWLLSAVRYLCATLPLTASVASLCTTKKKTQAVYGCTCVLYVAFLCMYMLRLSIF